MGFKYDNYVCGTRLQALADIEFNRNGSAKVNREGLSDIVYCHTHDFRYVLNKISSIEKEVVLITHNSDGALKNSKEGDRIGENDADYALKPKNVKAWFAQNVECNLQDDIFPLPIGLENSYCFPYDKAKMLFDMEEASQDFIPSSKIYVNFNLRTNPMERNAALNACYNLKNKDLAHIKMRANGDNYGEYLDDITNCSYVLCPRGNGLDCHRTWETLYLGRIPIIKNDKSIATLLSDLPSVKINSWDDLHNIKLHWMPFLPSTIRSLWMPYWRFAIEYSAGRLVSR